MISHNNNNNKTLSLAFSTYAKTLSLAFPTYARTLSLEFSTYAKTLSLAFSALITSNTVDSQSPRAQRCSDPNGAAQRAWRSSVVLMSTKVYLYMIGGVPQLMSTTEVVKGQAWTNVMRGGIGSRQRLREESISSA